MEQLINFFNNLAGFAARPDYSKPGNALVTWVEGDSCKFKSVSSVEEAKQILKENPVCV